MLDSQGGDDGEYRPTFLTPPSADRDVEITSRWARFPDPWADQGGKKDSAKSSPEGGMHGKGGDEEEKLLGLVAEKELWKLTR